MQLNKIKNINLFNKIMLNNLITVITSKLEFSQHKKTFELALMKAKICIASQINL